ncbi:MAG: hypothetical protein ACJ8R9_11300 [Steroidobacteraceae bacterium]
MLKHDKCATPVLSIEKRLALHCAIKKLLAPNCPLHVESARLLIDTLPIRSRSPLLRWFAGWTREETVRGFSPGVGSAELSDKRAHHAHSDEPGMSCGAYKLSHYRGKLFIDHFGYGGPHYLLRYSRSKLVLWEFIISALEIPRLGIFAIAMPEPYKRHEMTTGSI